MSRKGKILEFLTEYVPLSLLLTVLFSVLFFVSVGMLFEPNVLVVSPMQILTTVAVIILGKSLIAFLIVLALRYPLNTALTVSASLAQIGEFSFILAALGLSLGLLSNDVHSIILASALISIAINPFIFKAIKPLQRWLQVNSKLARKLQNVVDPLTELPPSINHQKITGQVVLIGYGTVGRKVAECLNDRGIHFIVVEKNRKLVEDIRNQGIAAVAGNAAEPSALMQAHIDKASMLIIAAPVAFYVRSIIKTAKALNPSITSLIRTRSENDAQSLEDENIGKVFQGDHEVAMAITRHIVDTFEKEKATGAESRENLI